MLTYDEHSRARPTPPRAGRCLLSAEVATAGPVSHPPSPCACVYMVTCLRAAATVLSFLISCAACFVRSLGARPGLVISAAALAALAGSLKPARVIPFVWCPSPYRRRAHAGCE